ncbi:hypothetical protein [Streptomyces sp. NPDC051132]|uniref:hypothetical protein n=1 Tax=unclassified Streptomyces TaxID=2593676 RepID=UPI00342D16EF
MTGAGRTVHRGLMAIAVTGTRQVESRRGVLAELFERVLAPFADGPAADRGRLLGGAAGVDTSTLRFPAGRDAGRLVVTVPVRCADQQADAREAIEQAHAAARVERIVEPGQPHLVAPLS